MRLWVVEVDQGGINWTPIAQCVSEKQANALAQAPHIVGFGRPVRVRERGVANPLANPTGEPSNK